MVSLGGEIEAHGGAIAYSSPVVAGDVSSDGVRLQLGDAEESSIAARFVINSAGLEAPVVAASLMGFSPSLVPPRCFAKGTYFSLLGKSPFSHLIYPVPERGGLGVHLTLDLAGQARFGPDVEWVDFPEYDVDGRKAQIFFDAIRQYWPGCSLDRLQPAYAGIRPKLGTQHQFADDFEIQCEHTHQIPGLVNLFGIESPGLTSCLAIADEVAARINVN
jgi:L-2-hydroxyglutarate oxidase LhgO